jgi:hypothetical protein
MTYRLAQRRKIGRGFISIRGRAEDGGLDDGPSPVGVGICAATGSAPSNNATTLVIAIRCLRCIAG